MIKGLSTGAPRRLFPAICALVSVTGAVAWSTGAFLVGLAAAAAPEAVAAAWSRLRGSFRRRPVLRQPLQVRSARQSS